MDSLTPLQIEAEARLNNLRMNEVCRRANVAFSTFWKWKARNGRIPLDSYERLVRAAKGLPVEGATK
jgi:hypothetical protein